NGPSGSHPGGGRLPPRGEREPAGDGVPACRGTGEAPGFGPCPAPAHRDVGGGSRRRASRAPRGPTPRVARLVAPADGDAMARLLTEADVARPLPTAVRASRRPAMTRWRSAGGGLAVALLIGAGLAVVRAGASAGGVGPGGLSAVRG